MPPKPKKPQVINNSKDPTVVVKSINDAAGRPVAGAASVFNEKTNPGGRILDKNTPKGTLNPTLERLQTADQILKREEILANPPVFPQAQPGQTPGLIPQDQSPQVGVRQETILDEFGNAQTVNVPVTEQDLANAGANVAKIATLGLGTGTIGNVGRQAFSGFKTVAAFNNEAKLTVAAGQTKAFGGTVSKLFIGGVGGASVTGFLKALSNPRDQNNALATSVSGAKDAVAGIQTGAFTFDEAVTSIQIAEANVAELESSMKQLSVLEKSIYLKNKGRDIDQEIITAKETIRGLKRTVVTAEQDRRLKEAAVQGATSQPTG